MSDSNVQPGQDLLRYHIVESAGDDTSPTGVTVVVNWLDELERRVPR